jgi:hypothetical protein
VMSSPGPGGGVGPGAGTPGGTWAPMMRWVAHEGVLLGSLPGSGGRIGPGAAGPTAVGFAGGRLRVGYSPGASEAGLFDKSDALLATLGRQLHDSRPAWLPRGSKKICLFGVLTRRTMLIPARICD